MALLVSPLTPISPPALSATPGFASPGARVQIAGANFTQRSKVQLTWDGSTGGMPILTIARNGRFTATMVVPNAAPGRHTLGVMTVPRTSPRLRAQSRVQESVLATTTFNILPGTPVTALSGGDPAGSADSPTFTPDPAAGNATPTDAPLPIATLDPTTAAPTEPGTTPAPDPTSNAAVDPTAEPTVNATPKPDPTAKPPSTPKPDPTPDPTPKPTPKPPAPGGGIPATPAGDLLRKDFSDGSLWPFRVVDYPNDHPDDPMSYACDYGTGASVVSVHDGYLDLRANRKNDGRWNCGFVSTGMDGRGNSASFSFTHGYLQFAARMNVGHATWQAPLWLLNTVTGWHPAEIDVAEVISGRLTYNLHGTVNKQVASTAPGNIGSTWHVFGVAKTSTHITFTMDGNVVGRWNGNMPDPMALLADSKVGFKWDGVYPNGSTPDPTWVKLAWVTVSSKIPAGL
jgi:hypothetical protein